MAEVLKFLKVLGVAGVLCLCFILVAAVASPPLTTQDIPQEQLDSLLGDMYDIRKLDVDLSHCRHGGASRRRVYFLLTLKDAFEVLAEPSDLYQMVVDIVKSVGQTRVPPCVLRSAVFLPPPSCKCG